MPVFPEEQYVYVYPKYSFSTLFNGQRLVGNHHVTDIAIYDERLSSEIVVWVLLFSPTRRAVQPMKRYIHQ